MKLLLSPHVAHIAVLSHLPLPKEQFQGWDESHPRDVYHPVPVLGMAIIHLRQSRFLPGTQIAKAHYKLSAGLTGAGSKLITWSGLFSSKRTCSAVLPSSLPFYQSPTGHFQPSIFLLHTPSLTIADNICSTTSSRWCRGRTGPCTRCVGIFLPVHNMIL